MSYGSNLPTDPSSAPPPNYLLWAILTTIFCFWPVGIVSIVFSTQVNAKWASGDLEGAQASSRKAKTFAIVTAAVGLFAAVIVFLFLVFFLTAGIGTTTTP
jgi:hypothetical protein